MRRWGLLRLMTRDIPIRPPSRANHKLFCVGGFRTPRVSVSRHATSSVSSRKETLIAKPSQRARNRSHRHPRVALQQCRRSGAHRPYSSIHAGARRGCNTHCNIATPACSHSFLPLERQSGWRRGGRCTACCDRRWRTWCVQDSNTRISRAYNY